MDEVLEAWENLVKCMNVVTGCALMSMDNIHLQEAIILMHTADFAMGDALEELELERSID